MPLYRWEIIRRRKPVITRKLHDVSQVLYLPFDKDHEPYSVESYDPTQVLRLPFEDPPQEITYDRSGHGNDGTIYGATRVIGKVRNALKFDGVDDYVNLGDVLSLDYPFSIGCWFKTPDVTKNNQVLVSKQQGPPNWYGYILYFAGTTGKIDFAVNTPTGASYIRSDDVMKNDVWTHIVGVYDGSYLKLYINGVQAASPVAFSEHLTAWASELWIGKREYGEVFEGIIDEVRIYIRVLSQDEIKRPMNLRGV